jgi:glycosyltransferase involved in cell wall biosynthesis
MNGTDVVLMGGFDFEYPREISLKRGLESQDIEVRECRYSDEQLFISPRKLLLLPLLYWRLWTRYREIERTHGNPSAIVLTKFDHLLLPLAWYLSRRSEAPLFYDVFVSLQGTVEMRGYHPLVVRAIALLERVSLKLPDYFLTATEQLAELNAELSSLPRDRFVIIPPGADEERFYPRTDVETREVFTVLYWGNHLPHHGMETIIRAADGLREKDDIEFVILGEGPEEPAMKALASELGLPNVEFKGRVPWDDLFDWIARSDVGLGVFSAEERALASITNKVCEGVAMGKAMITERSPATEDWFVHGEDIYLVPPEDPQALETAIETLKRNPELRETLERGARETHEEAFSVERIGEILADAISTATAGGPVR